MYIRRELCVQNATAALSFIIGNDDNNERRRSTQQVRYSFLHIECPDRYRQIDDDALDHLHYFKTIYVRGGDDDVITIKNEIKCKTSRVAGKLNDITLLTYCEHRSWWCGVLIIWT